MGYRSNVYLKTTTEGWITLKRFNDSLEKGYDQPLYGAEVNKSSSGCYKIYFEDVKWYEGYKQVENFNEALAKMEALDIPFSFIRLGEETDDIEHRCNWTDDIPDEINSFEPVVDVNDDEYGSYESVDLDTE